MKRHLGRYKLQALTPLQIEKFYAELLDHGGRNGNGLAPKTSGSRRTVYVHNTTIKTLHQQRQLQAEERLAAGPAWDTDNDLVFRNLTAAWVGTTIRQPGRSAGRSPVSEFRPPPP